MKKQRLFMGLVGLLLLLIGVWAGVVIALNLTVTHWDVVAPTHLFSAQPALPLPSLSSLTSASSDDTEAIDQIVTYAHDHLVLIETVFREANPVRAQALWVMYEIHVGHLYGTRDLSVTSLREYLATPFSDCGASSAWQSLLLTALGISWRAINISGGTHVFVEAQINGQWEIFDSTVNVWIDHSAYELNAGVNRESRAFYTPMLDQTLESRVDAGELRTVQELRLSMPLLGLAWTPKAVLFAS